jgi:hypothetical protein
MCLNEDSLNHLLGKATILQFVTYPPNGLHIFLVNGAILTIYAQDGKLEIDVMGPDVPERIPQYES